MATATVSRASSKRRKSSRSKVTASKPDTDCRYRFFVPGDIELKQKPPHPLYLPRPADMCSSLTEEIDFDDENLELVTRSEAIARVVEFNRKVLADWQDDKKDTYLWSMALETGIDLIGNYGAYSITIEEDLTGFENRRGDRKVRIVRPTRNELRKFGIKTAQPDHFDQAEFGLSSITPDGKMVLLERGMTLADACNKKRKASTAGIFLWVLSPGHNLLKRSAKPARR